MIAQLVKDFVHLECRRNRLDQHGRADRPARNAEFILRQIEYIIPNPRLEMALHFRQVKIRTGAALDQRPRVVKKEQTEIEQRARDRCLIDNQVFFIQMPAARPNE